MLDSPELSSDPRDGKRCCIQEMLFPYHRNDDCRQLGFKFLENTFFPLKDFFSCRGFLFFCGGGGGSVCRVAQKEEESWEKGNWGEKKGERPKPRCLLLRLKVQNSPRFPAKKSGKIVFFLLIWLIMGQR